MDDTLLSYPFNIHDALTNVLHDLNGDLYQSFVNKAKFKSPPRVNILFYLPRLQASIHIIPFKTLVGGAGLPSIDSSIYNEIANVLKKVETQKILANREVKALLHFALRCPNVRTCINDLNSSKKKLFSHLGCSNDSTASLVKLIEIFNENNTDALRKLENPGLLQSVLHVMLSIIPQFDDAMGASLDDNAYGWKSYDEKIARLEALALSFNKQGSELPFKDRLFLLLSLIESIQWPKNSSFGHFGNVYAFLEKNSLPESQDLLKRDAIFTRQIKLYFYGSYSENPFPKTKDYLREMLLKYSSDIAQLFKAFSFERYKEDLMNFPDLLEQPANSLAQGLLNFIKPDYMVIGPRDKKNNSFLELASVNDKRRKLSPSESIDADMLLRTPWSTYSLIDEVLLKPEKVEEINKEFNRVIHLSPENINKPISPSSDNTAIFIDLIELIDVNDGIIIKFQNKEDQENLAVSSSTFVDLIRQLVSYNRNIALGATVNGWYKKAFSPLYELFDCLRQARAEFAEREEHEAAFLLAQLNMIPNCENPLVVDLGIGYGRVTKKLFNLNKKLRIVGVDQSQALTKSFMKNLSEENQKRLKIFNIDFQDLEILEEYYNRADLVIIMFTTFGCYDNDDDNSATLSHAYKLLRPGGMLIIEQFNPERERDSAISFEVYPKNGEEAKSLSGFSLIKTSKYEKEATYCVYLGHYFYFKANGESQNLIKCDDYRLRLYCKTWFEEQRKKWKDATVNYYGDFKKTNGSYEIYGPSTSPLLITCIRNEYYPSSDTEPHAQSMDLYSCENIYNACLVLYARIKETRNELLTNINIKELTKPANREAVVNAIKELSYGKAEFEVISEAQSASLYKDRGRITNALQIMINICEKL